MVKLYEVGGFVRDGLLGIRSKDIDFAVEAESFDDMRAWLVTRGFKIFVETEEYLTIRAHFPTHWPNGLSSRLSEYAALKITADFVLCRKDGLYTDGRRPDTVTVGTIYDDLARRDFTVNAMAITEAGDLLDPYCGAVDLANKTLRCVGLAENRIREDALRALRAIRFRVTKGLEWDAELRSVLNSAWLPELMFNVSRERQREELHKAFKHNTVQTMSILIHDVSVELTEVIFEDGIWLKPTTER